MALATSQDLITMFPELASVDSGTLDLYLGDARLFIIGIGISTTSPYFAKLQRYKAASLMSGNGLLGSDVESGQVADVSVSYGGKGGDLNSRFPNKWEYEFHRCLTNLLGMTSRMC